MGHSDERTGRLEVDLGVAQPLGGSDELGHGAAHTGKALADLIPIEISYGGHGVGQHVHCLREFHEGRTGLDEIGGLNALHRLRDRFKTDVKLGHQAADGRDAANDFTATEGGDLLHRVNKQSDGSSDLHKSERLNASSECVQRFFKTTEDLIEYTSALLELFSPITEEVLDGFLDRIECSTKLLRGQEDAAAGKTGEDVTAGDVIRDPRQDVTDDVLDAFERPAEYVADRRRDRSDGGSHRRDSSGKGAEDPEHAADGGTDRLGSSFEYTELLDRFIESDKPISKSGGDIEQIVEQTTHAVGSERRGDGLADGLDGLYADIKDGEDALSNSTDLV